MESKTTSNLFYSPPALTQHVDYQSKAEKRKAELEALRQQSITKQKASQLKTAEAPKEFADFDQKQRSFLNEQRHRQRHAKDLLHQYRADEQMVLSHATPRRRPMSDASTANRLSRSPDAFASVYHSPDYSVVPFPESVTLSPHPGGYGDGDDDSTNENVVYYPAACTDSLPDVEQSVQYYDDQAIFYQAQEEEEEPHTSDIHHDSTFTPTNAQRPPSLDPTESGTTGATSTQSTPYYNSPFVTSSSSMDPTRQELFSPSNDSISSPLFVRESTWASPMATGSPTVHMSQVDPTDGEDPTLEQKERNDPVDSLPSATTNVHSDSVEKEVHTLPATTLELDGTTTSMDDIVTAGGDPMSSFESCQQDDFGLEGLEAAATSMAQDQENDHEVADACHVPAVHSPEAFSEPLPEATGFEEKVSDESCETPKKEYVANPWTDSETAVPPNIPTIASTPIPANDDIATELSNISLTSPEIQLLDTNDVDASVLAASETTIVEPLVATVEEMEDIQPPAKSPLAVESPAKEPKQHELDDPKNESTLHHDIGLIESPGAARSNDNPSPSPALAPALLELSHDNDTDNMVPLDSTSCLAEDEKNTQSENTSESVHADKVETFTTPSGPQIEDVTVPVVTTEVTVMDGSDVCDNQLTEDSPAIQPEPSDEPLVLSSDADSTNDISICTKETASATAAQEASICSGRSSRTTRTKTQTKTPSDWSSMFARYLGNQRYTR